MHSLRCVRLETFLAMFNCSATEYELHLWTARIRWALLLILVLLTSISVPPESCNPCEQLTDPRSFVPCSINFRSICCCCCCCWHSRQKIERSWRRASFSLSPTDSRTVHSSPISSEDRVASFLSSQPQLSCVRTTPIHPESLLPPLSKSPFYTKLSDCILQFNAHTSPDFNVNFVRYFPANELIVVGCIKIVQTKTGDLGIFGRICSAHFCT